MTSSPAIALLSVLLFAGLAAESASAWPAAKGGASGDVGSACEDLADEPITYGMEYDLPGTGLPKAPLDLHDVWLAGGCVGCHNQTAMGNLRLDDPQFAGYQLVDAVSFRNPLFFLVKPGDPEASLLYAQLNCTPPATYPVMPPQDGPKPIRIPRALRAIVYDWIAQGARGFDVDGNPYSPVLFRDGLESQRFQRNLAPSP